MKQTSPVRPVVFPSRFGSLSIPAAGNVQRDAGASSPTRSSVDRETLRLELDRSLSSFKTELVQQLAEQMGHLAANVDRRMATVEKNLEGLGREVAGMREDSAQAKDKMQALQTAQQRIEGAQQQVEKEAKETKESMAAALAAQTASLEALQLEVARLSGQLQEDRFQNLRRVEEPAMRENRNALEVTITAEARRKLQLGEGFITVGALAKALGLGAEDIGLIGGTSYRRSDKRREEQTYEVRIGGTTGVSLEEKQDRRARLAAALEKAGLRHRHPSTYIERSMTPVINAVLDLLQGMENQRGALYCVRSGELYLMDCKKEVFRYPLSSHLPTCSSTSEIAAAATGGRLINMAADQVGRILSSSGMVRVERGPPSTAFKPLLGRTRRGPPAGARGNPGTAAGPSAELPGPPPLPGPSTSGRGAGGYVAPSPPRDQPPSKRQAVTGGTAMEVTREGEGGEGSR